MRRWLLYLMLRMTGAALILWAVYDGSRLALVAFLALLFLGQELLALTSPELTAKQIESRWHR